MESKANKEFNNMGIENEENYDLNSLNNGLLKYKDSLNLLDTNINKFSLKHLLQQV